MVCADRPKATHSTLLPYGTLCLKAACVQQESCYRTGVFTSPASPHSWHQLLPFCFTLSFHPFTGLFNV